MDIGKLTRGKDGSTWSGKLLTLDVDVSFVVKANEEKQRGDNHPDYLAFAGKVQVGSGWQKRTNEGQVYISFLFDNPGWPAPINCAAFIDGVDECGLVWSRPKAKKRVGYDVQDADIPL